MEERAEELTRDVRRLEAEAAAVAARLDGGNERQKARRLLPDDGRDERIAKYERHLHSLLTSTLHELERLQARREGESVPPPAVADVNMTVDVRDRASGRWVGFCELPVRAPVGLNRGCPLGPAS